MAASDRVDQGDLKRVKGIGAKVEARLKGAGITTFERLARTPVNELAALLEGLPGRFDADRITREEWLPQAAALAAAPAGEAGQTKVVRHNFTVEVRLDMAGREIVSSRITHVPTGDEATWAGWEPQRVVAFIEDRAGTRAAGATIEPESERPPEKGAGAGDAGLTLHTFASVPASGFASTAGEAVTAVLSFGTQTLGLPADQLVRVQADVYAHRPPPGKSLLVGSTVADVSPSGLVRLRILCHLPATQPLADVFALVRVLAAARPGGKPSGSLPDARLTITGTMPLASG
jgi:hypothetical protein